MSEAPERIWAWPSERGWYAAECSYEVNLGLLTPECDLQTDYIRADIHEDRIKELEDALSWYEQTVRELATATDQRADQAKLALDSDRGKTARKALAKQHKGGKT
jgi:hypothetical protein